MYLPDADGWRPGDPTPEQIFQRTAECHEFRKLGIPVPEQRHATRAAPMKGNELVMDLLADGIKPREIAIRLGIPIDEVKRLAADFSVWVNDSDPYLCPTCRAIVKTTPCVRCEVEKH